MRAVHLISNLCLIVSAQSDTARPRFASTRPQNLDPSHAGSAVQGFADLPQLIIFVPCHPRLQYVRGTRNHLSKLSGLQPSRVSYLLDLKIVGAGRRPPTVL
jgi:hypothetical protein